MPSGSIGILASSGPQLDSCFARIGNLLRARGHPVHYAAGTPMARARAAVIPAVTRSSGMVNLRAGRELRRWVEVVDADVVLASSEPAGLLARRAGLTVPVVYLTRGLPWHEGGTARAMHRELLERWRMSHTAAAIILHEEDRAWFARWAPDLPVHHLPFGMGLSPEAFRPCPQPDNNVVMWVGEHTPHARPWLAVQITAELRSRGTPIRLRMLGSGPLTRQIARQAEQLGVAGDVELPGHTAVTDEIRAARLVLHTAARETQPRVVLQALAVHRPVAAFDVPGMRGLPAVELALDRDVTAGADLVEHLLAHPVPEEVFPSREELSDERAAITLESILAEAVNSAQGRTVQDV